MIGDLISAGFKIIEKVIPDKKAQLEAKQKLVQLEQDGKMQELQAAMNVVVAEAKGESWLQRNWRPITMLSFLALLFLYWFGIQPEGLTQDTINKLFDLLQIGIGGYIVGRSLEKGVKEWKKD